jgi:hypothetical protein
MFQGAGDTQNDRQTQKDHGEVMRGAEQPGQYMTFLDEGYVVGQQLPDRRLRQLAERLVQVIHVAT